MTFGTRVQAARIREGLTQKALAGKLGASQHYISDIERNVKHPSEAMLRRLAAALDETPESLLYPVSPSGTHVPESGAVTMDELEELATAAGKILRVYAAARLRANS